MDESKEIDMSQWPEGEYKQSLLSKIRDWADEYKFIRYKLYWCDRQDWLHPSRIYRKITNVVRWVPILWNDVDWDYNSFYVMMHTKVKFMKEHHIAHHNHTDWEEVVGQMQTMEDALDRLIKDDYLSAEWDAHHAAFPRVPHDQWEKTADGCTIMPEMKEEARTAFHKHIDAEDALRQADMQTVGTLFTKHTRGWWD